MEDTKTAVCRGDDPFLLLLHLPEEVLIQILVRLPIQSLLQFKCVCKSWRDLIQTSYFIHIHTATTFNSSSSSNFGTFILRTENFSDENVILMLSISDEEDGSGSEYGDWYRYTDDGSWLKVDDDDDDDDDELLLKVDNLELIPSNYKLTYGKVIAGSCNGLICLHDQELRDVSLWNPVTRKFRCLPKSITINEIDDNEFVQHGGVDFVAFGFDVKTKDYKVLLITRFRRAQVYSLSTDSWMLLEGINTRLALPAEHHGLYLNGSCFFLASVYHPETNTRSWFINSFDFTKEIFTTMQLPDDDHRRHLFLCLGGEKMALFTTLRKRPSDDQYDSDDSNDADGYDDCDIWVLNEHGGCGVNKEIWTKLHSFQIGNSRNVQPRGILNNGKFALLETTLTSYSPRIQLYNLVTKEEKMGIHFCQSMSNIYVYKPSLVSIIGGNGAAAAPDGHRMIGGAM